MDLPDDSPIWDLLARWEEQRRQGQGVAVEELCERHPELIEPMRQAIHALECTSWLEKPLTEEPEDRSQDLNFPAAIGEYNLLERIGVGGMGQVYKARHRRMDRIVALKILPEVAFTSAETLARFQQEVQATAKLHHPNIVTAYDAGEIKGRPYLIMEYVEGSDLARLLQANGTLPVAKAIDIISQVALALEYAHGKGIVHGDIKPGNLLLTPDGTVKILDLGLARFKATTEGEPVAGTVDYLPPERMTLAAPVDPRSDIYSLGCTLFTLLTGKPPFAGATAVEKLLAHKEGRIPSLKQVRPDAGALDSIFRRMVAREPGDRWQSMAQVAEALKAVHKPKRRWPAAILLSVVLLLLGAVGYVTIFVGSKEDAADRRAARWAADIGGSTEVLIHSSGEQVTIRGDKQLPAGSIKVVAIGLVGNREITDDGLANLTSLKAIDQINLSRTLIKGPGLKHLGGLTNLTYLNLHATLVDDAGLTHLKGLTNLRALALDGLAITDDGLKHLAGLTNLTDLSLSNTRVSDAGLVHLEGLTKLNLLTLNGTKVSEKGVRRLQAALPDCKIRR